MSLNIDSALRILVPGPSILSFVLSLFFILGRQLRKGKFCALLWNSLSLWAHPGGTQCLWFHLGAYHASGSHGTQGTSARISSTGNAWSCFVCSLSTGDCWIVFHRIFPKTQQTAATGRAEIEPGFPAFTWSHKVSHTENMESFELWIRTCLEASKEPLEFGWL